MSKWENCSAGDTSSLTLNDTVESLGRLELCLHNEPSARYWSGQLVVTHLGKQWRPLRCNTIACGIHSWLTQFGAFSVTQPVQPTNQPINQPINQPTNQPTTQQPTQPTNQNQRTDQPTNQPANHPTSQPTNRPIKTNEPANQPSILPTSDTRTNNQP